MVALMDDPLGMYLDDILDHEVLDKDELLALVARARAGDEDAMSRVVEHNLRLVVSVAKGLPGLPLQDRISHGVVGLIRSVELYDPEMSRFSTYAHLWIRQAIRRATRNEQHAIRQPSYIRDLVTRLRVLEDELGHEASIEQVVEVMPPRKTEDGSEALARRVMRAAGSPVDPVPADSWGASHVEPDPLDQLLEHDQVDQLRDALGQLDERRLIVLVMRYGLDGGGRRTQRAVGAHIGASVSTVQTLEKSALEVLRRALS